MALLPGELVGLEPVHLIRIFVAFDIQDIFANMLIDFIHQEAVLKSGVSPVGVGLNEVLESSWCEVAYVCKFRPKAAVGGDVELVRAFGLKQTII